MRISHLVIFSAVLHNFAHCPPKPERGVLEIQTSSTGRKIWVMETATSTANAIAACRRAGFTPNAMSAFLALLQRNSILMNDDKLDYQTRHQYAVEYTTWTNDKREDCLDEQGYVRSVIVEKVRGTLILPTDITEEELIAYNCTPQVRQAILAKSFALAHNHHYGDRKYDPNQAPNFTWSNRDPKDIAFKNNVIFVESKYPFQPSMGNTITQCILVARNTTYAELEKELAKHELPEAVKTFYAALGKKLPEHNMLQSIKAIWQKLLENQHESHIKWHIEYAKQEAFGQRWVAKGEPGWKTYSHITFLNGIVRIPAHLLQPTDPNFTIQPNGILTSNIMDADAITSFCDEKFSAEIRYKKFNAEKARLDLLDAATNYPQRFGKFVYGIQAKIILTRPTEADFTFNINDPEDLRYLAPIHVISWTPLKFIMSRNDATVWDLVETRILPREELAKIHGRNQELTGKTDAEKRAKFESDMNSLFKRWKLIDFIRGSVSLTIQGTQYNSLKITDWIASGLSRKILFETAAFVEETSKRRLHADADDAVPVL